MRKYVFVFLLLHLTDSSGDSHKTNIHPNLPAAKLLINLQPPGSIVDMYNIIW